MVFSFLAVLYVDNDRQQMNRYSIEMDDLIKSRPRKDVKAIVDCEMVWQRGVQLHYERNLE